MESNFENNKGRDIQARIESKEMAGNVTPYRVINKKEAQDYISSFKTMVEFWHDRIKPKYIFLDETSATPWGYLIKEAWRSAYTKEELPQFFRIDPQVVGGRGTFHEQIVYSNDILSRQKISDKSRRQLMDKAVKFIRERIKDKDAQIIIFDEAYSDGSSGSAVAKAIIIAMDDVEPKGKIGENIHVFYNVGEYRKGDLSRKHAPANIHDSDPYIAKKSYWPKFKTTEKGSFDVNRVVFPFFKDREKDFFGANEKAFPNIMDYSSCISDRVEVNTDRVSVTGSPIKDPEERKRALDYIHDLKLVGRKLGQTIKEHKEHKNKK